MNRIKKDKDSYIVEIPLKLPSLNEYIHECNRNRYNGGTLKRNTEADIAIFINALPEFKNPVSIKFKWIEGNRKRDLDNIAFGKKFILDTLVKQGKLKNDTPRYVTSFTDTFGYEKDYKVILTIKEHKGVDHEDT